MEKDSNKIESTSELLNLLSDIVDKKLFPARLIEKNIEESSCSGEEFKRKCVSYPVKPFVRNVSVNLTKFVSVKILSPLRRQS